MEAFKAWVMVDRHGNIFSEFSHPKVFVILHHAEALAKHYNEWENDGHPHRVVPVLVTPVKEEE